MRHTQAVPAEKSRATFAQPLSKRQGKDKVTTRPHGRGEGGISHQKPNLVSFHPLLPIIDHFQYLVGFTEYVYLRILSIVAPEHTIYHPTCEDKHNRRIGKDGFHYGVSLAAFLAIALFQLIVSPFYPLYRIFLNFQCYLGLTISENWTATTGDNVEPAREQFVLRIRQLIGHTMYRVFCKSRNLTVTQNL